MELDDTPDVDVADTITVSHQKRRLAAEPAPYLPQPSAGGGRAAGVHDGDSPGRHVVAREVLDRAGGKIEHRVTLTQPKPGEVLGDRLALVAAGYDEVVDAGTLVDLADVPENRVVADLDEGLRLQIRLFGEPAARAAGEYDRLHPSVPSCRPQGRSARD